MRTLYVVRHGETVWNAEQRMQGRLDSGLTPRGQEQATRNGQCLKALGGADAMIVSPLGRTRETAFLINSHLRAPMEFEDALMERDCGQWSGLSVDEVETQFPQAWQARLNDPYHHRPPGGENLADMLDRSRDFLDSLFEFEAERVVLVTHGIMSRVILIHLLGLAPERAHAVRHPNDLIYRLAFGVSDIVVDHFVAGEGPRVGLLRSEGGETIPLPGPGSR